MKLVNKMLFFLIFVLKLTDAFNPPTRLSSSPNSNHNSIYHSIYHLDKDNYYTNHKNKSHLQSLNHQLNQQSNQQSLDVKETEQRLYLGQAHIQFTLDLLGNYI